MTDTAKFDHWSDGAGCTIISDRRYLPIYISIIRGKATTEGINFYYAKRDEVLMAAVKSGDKVAVVNDMTDFEIPPATARKALGEGAKKDPEIE
jgi:hypothetical protein